MGSWNQTCGITNIHIRSGERVTAFAIVEDTQDNMCYTTGLFVPFMLPIYGEYDDYGRLDQSTGLGFTLLLERLNTHAVERPVGENQRREIAIERGKFDDAYFWNAIHLHRIQVESRWGEVHHHNVKIMMVKSSVIEFLLDSFKLTRHPYCKEKKFQYTFRDVLNQVDALVDAMFTLFNADADAFLFNSFAKREIPDPSIELIQLWINSSFSHLMHRSAFIHLGGKIQEFITSGNRDQLVEFMNGTIISHLVDQFFMETRKVWIPQGGNGSQADDHDGYITLIDAMQHALDLDNQYFDDCEDCEDD